MKLLKSVSSMQVLEGYKDFNECGEIIENIIQVNNSSISFNDKCWH